MFVPEAAQASRDCFLHISDLSAAGKATLSAADFFAPVSVKNNDAKIMAEIIGRNNRAEIIAQFVKNFCLTITGAVSKIAQVWKK